MEHDAWLDRPPDLKEDPEHAAIRDVIRRCTQAVVDCDFETYASFWGHTERTTGVYNIRATGVTVLRGWSRISEALRRFCDSKPPYRNGTFDHRNHVISVCGDMAWVTFEQLGRSLDDQPFLLHAYQFETRILERGADGWKIVYMSFSTPSETSDPSTRIEVDAEARVISLPDCLRDRLRDHEGLTVSCGRLRARQRRWDKGLRTTIGRAAQLGTHYHQYVHSLTVHGMPTFPVLLGEDERGGVLTCAVLAIEGSVFVRLDDGEAYAPRLDRAAIVFGLSAAQQRLAAEIVRGHTLPAAARTLGISGNTARTHLNRIFDKTGVHGQAALVRILLSVGG
jgi:DNA-binding CsgD family transcriptional regulator/ketosteroid isomerase-like protein